MRQRRELLAHLKLKSRVSTIVRFKLVLHVKSQIHLDDHEEHRQCHHGRTDANYQALKRWRVIELGVTPGGGGTDGVWEIGTP